MHVLGFLKEEKFLLEEQFKNKNKKHKRNIFNELEKSNIIFLYGLRGTGKTLYSKQEDKIKRLTNLKILN